MVSKQTKTRVFRTLVQLIVGGALYGLVDQLIKDVPEAYAPYIAIGYTLVVTVAQNIYEDIKKTDIVATRDAPAVPQKP